MGVYIERTPHLRKDLLERPLARFDLTAEHLTGFVATAMTIK